MSLGADENFDIIGVSLVDGYIRIFALQLNNWERSLIVVSKLTLVNEPFSEKPKTITNRSHLSNDGRNLPEPPQDCFIFTNLVDRPVTLPSS